MKRLSVILLIAAVLVSVVLMLGAAFFFWNRPTKTISFGFPGSKEARVKIKLRTYSPSQYKFEHEIFTTLNKKDRSKLKKSWKWTEGWSQREENEWIKKKSDGSLDQVKVDTSVWKTKLQNRENKIQQLLPNPSDEKAFLKQYHDKLRRDDYYIDRFYGSEKGSHRAQRMALQKRWEFVESILGDGKDYWLLDEYRLKQRVNVVPNKAVMTDIPSVQDMIFDN